MHPLVEEIKKDMDSFERNKEEYVKKVNYISDLLELKGKKRLLVNYPATYFVGNYKDTSNHKYVLVGLNPGYDENQNKLEKKWKEEGYENFAVSFFKKMKKHNFKSQYYLRISKFLYQLDKGYMDEEWNYGKTWDYCEKHILNFDLIPYHSRGIDTGKLKKALKNEEFRNYTIRRFKGIVDFIKELKNKRKLEIKAIIFNGKAFYVMIVENNLLGFNARPRVIFNDEKLNVYFFKIEDMPCFVFGKFIPRFFPKQSSKAYRKLLRKCRERI